VQCTNSIDFIVRCTILGWREEPATRQIVAYPPSKDFHDDQD
jgi:hypothetical protein